MYTTPLSNHSSEVEMYLDCGEHGRAKLKRITPSTVELWEPFDAPPCYAKLVVCINGDERSKIVNLINGLSRNQVEPIVLSIDEIASQ
jgi:hypothetical protein